MRLIHAVRDLSSELAQEITTIALYTDAERTAMFVREADEAYPIGPANQRPYLNHELLAEVLRQARADAVWVGWGFVAEDADFAELMERSGITFIGPSAQAMRTLGDKIGAKQLAQQVGVPVAAWSGGGVETLEAAISAAEEIGYPLMLKATAGGGGRGIRRVAGPEELVEAYQRTRDEAQRAFGSGTVFLERLVTDARHVEVQLIADAHGTAWALGVRDCTIQRRNQKIIEESASPLLSSQQSDELKASAERLALAVGYQGAGTVEFLYQPEQRSFAFLEVNTRLQVEHPITEVTNDFDLVKAQLRVAAGEPLMQRPTESGYAVEARLNAEDPDRDFAPAPGRIEKLSFGTGPGIRIDTGVAEGDEIPADFDSMIAKIIAHGRSRAEALARLRRALSDTTVVIEGGATNKSFVLELLDRPEVVGAPEVCWADTSWLDRVRAQGELILDRWSEIALVAAGIEAYEEAEEQQAARLLGTSRGGRPQVEHDTELTVELKLRGVTHQLSVARIGRVEFLVTSGEHQVRARLERLDRSNARIAVAGQRHRLVLATHGPVHFVEVDGVAHRVSRDEGGVLRAPAPALVVATLVAPGDEVAAGQDVIILESMKMETALSAPFAARIREVTVKAGTQVSGMAALIKLEPLAQAGDVASVGAQLVLPEPEQLGTRENWLQALADLRGAVLGFDPVPGALKHYLVAREKFAAHPQEVLRGECELFATFSDIAELTRNRPADEQASTELRVHSDREHLHTFLTTLDPVRAGLPDSFVARLNRVLAHYGVESLDRSAQLEQAVLRIFLASQGLSGSIGLIVGVLERWLVEPPPAEKSLAGLAREQLERLKQATQLRHATIGDLARSVRFRWFDVPAVDEERARVLAGMNDLVTQLAGLAQDSVEYRQGVAQLVAVPEKNDLTLAARLSSGVYGPEPMLEVLARKHYGDFGLRDLAVDDVAGRPVLSAEYTVDRKPTHLLSMTGRSDELGEDGPIAQLVKQRVVDRGHGAVVELYLSHPGTEIAGSDELRAQLGRWLPASVRRIVVALCSPAGRINYVTLRAGQRLVEDTIIRDHHPMVARRLDLWRLSEFDLKRLPATEDVLLIEARARANPEDHRLIAMAQVRQVSVLRSGGRLVGAPHVERAIEHCLESIRRTRTAMGKASSHLDMNHVWVRVWPTMALDPAEASDLQRKITPLTDSAGIEEVVVHGTFIVEGVERELAVRFHQLLSGEVGAKVSLPSTKPLQPIDDYRGKVLRARRRGLVYPYELAATLAGDGGHLVELDLEGDRLVEIRRPYGRNSAGIICARVSTPTALHPEGITRIVLAGDPTKGLGAVAEAECRRIIAALDLAQELGVPVEWYALSSGARVSMTSGTENMDWVGAALKRIVEFTQSGHEINVVIAGITVGAQPYWAAEATMLMHTKGILVMTPESAMVLTGKQSLDYSGGVSAEDNFGIGGYDRVMGPNGQAQYWAQDLPGAFKVLLEHYDASYVAAGETGPRRAPSVDPVDRDVSQSPHTLPGSEFATVGDIFSTELNPERKKPFDIRCVMRAVVDADGPFAERWSGMADAETAVVADVRMGGHSVCLVGIESRPVSRSGFPPTDGPVTYTAGTLFPRSSKKVARAINAASGNRPLVVLANLSGFDGSPESMRKLQLEYGAEIGRAIVNFTGPIVFVVISRYHGGAFVVFSKRLNTNMTVLALEGSFASVLGGAPAAAVVFAGEVAKRTAADARVSELEARLRAADAPSRAVMHAELTELRSGVRAEKISEIATEFDGTHSIHRAVEVGSVDRVISVAELRPAIIKTIESKL